MDDDKFTVFQERHAELSFHVAALMIAVMKLREAEHMVAIGHLGNAGGLKTELNYHKAKIKAIVQAM